MQQSPSWESNRSLASQEIQWTCEMFRHTVSFYGEDLLVTRPIPKLEHNPLSAVLFNTFASTIHI
jgi:hypothetical protein